MDDTSNQQNRHLPFVYIPRTKTLWRASTKSCSPGVKTKITPAKRGRPPVHATPRKEAAARPARRATGGARRARLGTREGGSLHALVENARAAPLICRESRIKNIRNSFPPPPLGFFSAGSSRSCGEISGDASFDGREPLLAAARLSLLEFGGYGSLFFGDVFW